MNKDVSNSFETYFGNLKDPRVERTKLYPLSEILFIVLTGSICGAESWRDFVIFGEERLDFYKNIIHLRMAFRQKIHFHVYLQHLILQHLRNVL